MENYMTLTEYLDKVESLTDLFTGISIDAATQEAIVEWYQYRYLCTQDPSKWRSFIRRLLTALQDQYYQLMRVNTTEFDPMVTRYLERLVENSHTASKEHTDSKSSATTGGTTVTTTEDGTTTESGSSETSGTIKDNGGSESQNVVNSTITDNGTTGGTTKNTTTNSGDANTSSKSLAGATPDSSTYTTGMPESLNWEYTSTQGEQSGTEHRTGTQTDEGTTSGTSTNTQTTSVTNGTDGTTFNNRTLSQDSTDSRRGSTSKEGSVKTVNDTTVTDTSEFSENESYDDETKERFTGREGYSPAVLLAQARDYVMSTNAFLWLVERLSPCFLMFYDFD